MNGINRRILAIVFSPANVISALGATLQLYGVDSRLTLGVCDWPGMTKDENRGRLEAFRRMTSQIPFVREVIPLTDEMAAQAQRSPFVKDTTATVQSWLAHGIDEIQYCHDLHGSIYQLACIAWPRTRRVSFGDGFGHIGTKEDYLSSQREDKGRAEAVLTKLSYRRERQWNAVRLALAKHSISSMPPAEHILFSPHEFRLYMPISDYGWRPPRPKLTVLSRSVFSEVLNFIRTSTDAMEYERQLTTRFGSRPAILLATENYIETGLLTLDQELSMWLDMLAPYLKDNPLIVVKQHPGEREPRWPLLAERLAGQAEVFEFAREHQRLPLEIFTGLIGKVTFVTSAFLRVSLNYLHGLDIPNPMTKTVIERYFPEWFWPHMTKGARDQDAYIEALAKWDSKSMLYVASDHK